MFKIVSEIVLVFFILLNLFTFSVFAESSYVLPYPSYMPGSKFYGIGQLWDLVLSYWHFGSFAKFSHALHMSDKYLVEAKTLFEYKQFLLAQRALKKSNKYFEKLPHYLSKAQKENKNIEGKRKLLKEAALKHVEYLRSIKEQVPQEFIWQEEKSAQIILNLAKEIDAAIAVRNNCL